MSSTGDALIGRTLDGRYRVLRRIADGGMATVYLAVDERLDREVALKVMRQHLTHDESFVTRFRREARSSASLSHPNVVAVFDQGEDDGHIFLAMEYVPGQTLRDVMREEGLLSPRAALDVLDPVLQALAEAHTKGLIHRDVKPENVIINDNGTVKVADFGLARAVTSQTVTSTQGVLLGTVAYLSPEQVERGIADARSDVYAAGLMLFEMLTGTKAFTGETAIHVAYQHVHGGVPSPSSRVAGLPPALDELVAVATARDPDERPADAAEFLTLVRRTRATLPAGVLDARPAGVAAGVAAAQPTATAALPLQRARPASEGAGGVATRPRSETVAIALPPPPLEGRVVAAGGGAPRRRRWWPAVVASALIAGLTAWFFLLGPGATATVPSVQGRTQAEAVSAVRKAALDPKVTEAFSEKVPTGVVISTDPGAGTDRAPRYRRRPRGVEGSRAVCRAPVVGMTLAEATARIEEVNLGVGKVTKAFDEKVPGGPGRLREARSGRQPEEERHGGADGEQGSPADRRARPHRQGRHHRLAPAQRPGPEGRRHEAAEQRHRRQGQGDQPGPPRRHPVQGRQGHARGLEGSGARRRAERRRAAARPGPHRARGRRVQGRGAPRARRVLRHRATAGPRRRQQGTQGQHRHPDDRLSPP